MSDVKRGDIFYVDLKGTVGSEQGGIRPALVIQNDIGNKYSPTTVIAAITSRSDKSKLPTHAIIPDRKESGLTVESMVLFEQVRTVDKSRLLNRIGHLDDNVMKLFTEHIRISFGLPQ